MTKNAKKTKSGSVAVPAPAGERKNMNKTEKQWQREDDVRTLGRYAEIVGNKTRRQAAEREARKQARQLEKEAKNLKKAAKRK